jgi:flagellar export protein FliJ
MSARFVFRLASVLRHRRRTEDAHAREVRQAIDRHQSAAARQAAIEHATRAARAALAASAAGGLSGAALGTFAEGVRDLTGRARVAVALTAAEAACVEERRVELVGAARARRALERLEEMRRSVWHAEVARAEQRGNDEAAAARRGAGR